ncbi:MAG: hypothetical protein KKA07_15615 [Bacteroidetes bacterium]|nr:hypothetical protein [Bacteroidota bacterium]MBU1720491.1 hypothetical protein [Bacteroidota bacterium]
MKTVSLFLLISCTALFATAQTRQNIVSADSVVVDSHVAFYTYNGPYGSEDNIVKPAIMFVLTVTNKSKTPIPDLQVSNRSQYVNFYINDTIQNPVSMYNGAEAKGPHLIMPGKSDSYTWWIFESEAYGKVFTIKWQYMNLFSKIHKVNMTKKTIEPVQ